MARNPKPLEMHKLNGNPSKLPNLPEPIDVPRERPPAPDHYDERHLEAWNYFVDAVKGMGVLSTIDAPAMEMLCDSWVAYQQNERDLQVEGYVMENVRGDIVPHPKFQVRKTLFQQIMQLLTQFGFTPVARAQLARSGGVPKKEEPDALQALLKRRQNN